MQPAQPAQPAPTQQYAPIGKASVQYGNVTEGDYENRNINKVQSPRGSSQLGYERRVLTTGGDEQSETSRRVIQIKANNRPTDTSKDNRIRVQISKPPTPTQPQPPSPYTQPSLYTQQNPSLLSTQPLSYNRGSS